MPYVTGRYGSQSSEASLIGSILSGDTHTIVNELIAKILKYTPISNLTREMAFWEPQYKSCHKRMTDGEKITLHELYGHYQIYHL